MGCQPQGRIGDNTFGHIICPKPMITGSHDVLVDCIPATRLLDTCLPHDCNGEVLPPYAIIGSRECFIDCLPAFRMLDTLSCNDFLAQGSFDCIVGG